MIINSRNLVRTAFALLISFLLITGCGKKEEQPEMQKSDTSSSTIVDTAKKMMEVKKDTIPDLTGNWTGIFDQRSATMSVIKQTGKEFSAIMTINYRQPLTKTVNGTIDTENKTVKMEDLNASKFPGKYTGQLSDDDKQIKGNFILRTNGKSYGFNFKMK